MLVDEYLVYFIVGSSSEDGRHFWRPSIYVGKNDVAVNVPILPDEVGNEQGLESDESEFDHIVDIDLLIDEDMIGFEVLAHLFVPEGGLLLVLYIEVDQR